MNFDRSEDEELLAATLARFVERDYGFEARRRIVASADGYSGEVWRKFAEMGLLGLTLPDDCGCCGGTATHAMVLMHAIGAALIVEPWLACVAVAAQLLARGGSEAQRCALLPAVAAGTLKLAFAHAEDEARDDPAHVAVRARREGDAYVIDGTKRVVPYAEAANQLLVSTRTSGDATDREGITLLCVDRSTRGIAVSGLRMLDGTRAADVSFTAVRVAGEAVVGAVGGALPLIEEVIDFATALMCAEAVGAIQSANEATLEHLRTRKQFGVPIGSFQALQHRMVDLIIEYEQAVSVASLACSAVDTMRNATQRARTVSAARVRIAEACRRVSQESIQLHGGIGMSDDMKISHTFRRLTAIARQFGDADYHLARFAALDRTLQEAS